MIGRALGTALLGSLALLQASPRAEAQNPAPVVVLGADVPGDAVVSRMYEELAAMGVRVEIAPPDTALNDLRELGRTHDAGAVIRVSRAGDVSIFPRDEAEPRHVPSGGDPATTALAAAELLRGHLAGVSRDETAAREVSDQATSEEAFEPARSVPTSPHPPADAPSARVRAGPALMLSPGGIPEQLAVGIGGELLLGRAHLSLEGHVGIPGITFTGKRDDVPIWTATLGVGAGYWLLPRESALGVGAGFGVAALAILFEQRNQTSVVVAALPHLRLVTRLAVSGTLALRADATAGYALPAPDIEIKGRNPTFAQPLVIFAVSLELGW